MQFPESWLRSFCNPPLSTQELAHTLTMAGLEVEELRPVAPPFSGVVVGEIREAVQHPNADRLRVCKVDVGSGTLLDIVCGAPNARVGIKVPCATVGAQLPPWLGPLVGGLSGVAAYLVLLRFGARPWLIPGLLAVDSAVLVVANFVQGEVETPWSGMCVLILVMLPLFTGGQRAVWALALFWAHVVAFAGVGLAAGPAPLPLPLPLLSLALSAAAFSAFSCSRRCCLS
jgi:hypothetical protein